MPLLTPTRELIRVPLTDRVFNDTVIKQEAVFDTLEHRQDAINGVAQVHVVVVVRSYANDNGEFGIALHDKGMPDKRVYLVADNLTVVNAETGEIVLIQAADNYFTWEEDIEALEGNVMFQGDFFLQLRDNAPIVIGDMIRQHIAQADAMGKFA